MYSEIARKIKNNYPNVFDNINTLHFVFIDVNKNEFVSTIGYTYLNDSLGYIWGGPITINRNASDIIHERLHIIGVISNIQNFYGFPDRGYDKNPGDYHFNVNWANDIMYHNGFLPPQQSLFGYAPLTSMDLIFLGWIKPEEILIMDSTNFLTIDRIKLTDVNFLLTPQQIQDGYRRIIKVMIKENYDGNADEYFLIEYHNATGYDKAFANYDEFQTNGFNKGILIWHIKEYNYLLNWGMDYSIDIETAVPSNGWYGNPIPNDNYPRNYNRPNTFPNNVWNGIFSCDFDYLDDDRQLNKTFTYPPDGGRHLFEVTTGNTDYTYRRSSMRSDFFTDETIKGIVTNKMTDATRPSTKTWGSSFYPYEPSSKTHIAITDMKRETGYMSFRVYYN